MALTRPAIGDQVSAELFGQPVYDSIIRAGVTRGGIQATFAAGSFTQLTWNTTYVDTHGFVSGDGTLTIPPGMGGVYAAAVAMHFTGATTGCYTSFIMPASVRFDVATTGARMSGCIVAPLEPGETVTINLYNGSGAVLTSSFSRLFVYRVSN